MLHQEAAEETSFSFSNAVPLPDERRRNDRQITILRVGTLIVRGRRELCLMRNISAGGLMAHVYSTMEPGLEVAIEFKTNQRVSGRIVWIRGSNAGIAFEEPIDIEELLATPAVLENGWRPRVPRIEVDRMAAVRAGARTCWVNVRDISLGGLKADGVQSFEDGENVVVTLEGFRPIPGVVRWQRNGICGITFNQFVPFSELITWLKQGG